MGRFSKLETGQHRDKPDLVPRAEALESGVAYPTGDAETEKVDLDASGWMRLGDEALYRDDKKAALRCYSRSMAKDSTLIQPWVAMIRTLLFKGDLSEATTWINRGLTLFPNSPHLLALRAVQYGHRGMIRQALNNSDAVLEQSSSEPLAHLARGEVLLLAENKNADYCFEQALKIIPPDDWRTLMTIGLILEDRRLWAKAIHFYARAAERNEHAAAVWYRVGLCRAELGHTQQAQKAFQEARDLCPPGDPLLPKIEHARPGSIFKRLRNLFRKT